MKVIFDLDGTLIDVSERMYRLFQALVPQSLLSKNEYWELKRDKISHEILLNKYFPEISFEYFNSKWMKAIETEEYILMDKNYSDTIDVLRRLSNKFNLYLLTSRQLKCELQRELEKLMLKKYFTDILVTERKYSKKELLTQYIKKDVNFLKDVKYFIGDVGEDIMLGNSFDLTTVAITHGFMNRPRLEEYQPKYIIDSLTELLEL